MLTAVTTVLREHGLVEPGEEPAYNITLVSPHAMNVAAYARSGAFFHVRVKKRGAIPAEHENYCRAWQSFPRHVPEPLVRKFKEDWEIIVIRGVRHRPVPAGLIANNKQNLVSELAAFLRASTGSHIDMPQQSHSSLLHEVYERADDETCAAILEGWIADARLDGLIHIRQHGDFVMNNLGLASGRLVVFDWEDFGRITLPGLDLCTLLASDAQFNVDTLNAIRSGHEETPSSYIKLLNDVCPAIGFSPEMFRELIPLYLVVFLDLKREYGKLIGRVLRKTIRELRHPDAGGVRV